MYADTVYIAIRGATVIKDAQGLLWQGDFGSAYSALRDTTVQASVTVLNCAPPDLRKSS